MMTRHKSLTTRDWSTVHYQGVYCLLKYTCSSLLVHFKLPAEEDDAFRSPMLLIEIVSYRPSSVLTLHNTPLGDDFTRLGQISHQTCHVRLMVIDAQFARVTHGSEDLGVQIGSYNSKAIKNHIRSSRFLYKKKERKRYTRLQEVTSVLRRTKLVLLWFLSLSWSSCPLFSLTSGATVEKVNT